MKLPNRKVQWCLLPLLFGALLLGCDNQKNEEEARGLVAEARHYLATGEASQKYKQAVPLLLKAAQLGNDQAMNHLGHLYATGLGVDRDDTLSLSWFQKAAEKGNADAMLGIGLAYAHGIGVEVDQDQAFSWYKKAVEHGSQEAHRYLVELL